MMNKTIIFTFSAIIIFIFNLLIQIIKIIGQNIVINENKN